MPFAAVVLIPVATMAALPWTARAQPPARSVRDGIYTEVQSRRGKALYAKACASCHGVELSGGEVAPPLAGAEFLAGWDGLSMGDLFERTRGSMPQNAPGSLGVQQVADVLAFVLAANLFPAGTEELPTDPRALRQFAFGVMKPAAPPF